MCEVVAFPSFFFPFLLGCLCVSPHFSFFCSLAGLSLSSALNHTPQSTLPQPTFPPSSLRARERQAIHTIEVALACLLAYFLFCCASLLLLVFPPTCVWVVRRVKPCRIPLARAGSLVISTCFGERGLVLVEPSSAARSPLCCVVVVFVFEATTSLSCSTLKHARHTKLAPVARVRLNPDSQYQAFLPFPPSHPFHSHKHTTTSS
ncbi:hypothetical protein PTSG_13252 [Salpingoeca rosetta]|uniref:Transmembrane protein n=1 Tax=Salpingoeca rosetta (strain ATCC 50818 / BSB-021) TaxID=946362 RepID=F2UFD1_SALR5|nr:uncharacterized protein PTSG_13252 [Salpingoeca rosetta]EGD75331.1 hypothetical protein PTSG_13252 [Salpingoeca rosetta]|eukprot:XP_004992384.1 hypothetical protein PTSG_13252 [Salpingoeca rosetta]